MSEKTSIIQRLFTIQQELQAPKSLYNDFGKYSYRNAEQIIETLKPLLKDAGLTLTFQSDVRVISERYYIEVTAMLIDAVTGERVTANALAREQATVKGQIEAQITGSTESFAKKYALANLFAISTGQTDYDDNSFTEAKEEQTRLSTLQESKALHVKLTDQNVNIPKLLEMLGKAKFEELTVADADRIGKLAEKGAKE